jgi:4'-phosphopantetheinyl transferase
VDDGWRTPNGRLSLTNGDVHLWRVDLDRHAARLPMLQETLATDERSNAAGFRYHTDRVRYAVSRGALRHVLARYLKTTPARVTMLVGAHGKPELAGAELRFNVSHAQGLAFFAITGSHDVGVDVEKIQPGIQEDLTGWFLPLRAIRLLELLPASQRRRAFFRAWTRMEAYAKASGDDLTVALDYFENFLHRPKSIQASAWWLHDFLPRRGYVGTVAARARKCKIKYLNWTI